MNRAPFLLSSKEIVQLLDLYRVRSISLRVLCPQRAQRGKQK